MEILRNVILALHFVGFAVLIGGVIAQIPAMKAGAAKIQAAVLHGAWTMLGTGVLLVGLKYALEEDVNNAKIGIKMLLLVVIAALALINKNKDRVATWVLPTIAGLTVVNIVIAAVWK